MILDNEYLEKYDQFANHFRKIIKERIISDKTMTQTSLGKLMHKSQNAINNWLTENKKYQCLPNAIDFLILCENLGINPSQFFDLNYSYQIYGSEVDKKTKIELSFIETSVYKDLKRILLECFHTMKLGVIITIDNNGTSRALDEFIKNNYQYAIKIEKPVSVEVLYEQIKDHFQVTNLDTFLSTQKFLLIFTNPELISFTLKDAILKEFYTDQALVFIYKRAAVEDDFLKWNIFKYYLKSISRYDIIEIITSQFPSIKMDVISLIEGLSRGNIKKVMEIMNTMQRMEKDKEKITKQSVLDRLFKGTENE